MAALIHPTAIVEPGARLGDGVELGAYAYVGAQVELGAGTKLHHHASVEGNTVLGSGCELFPYACIGGRSQDLKFRGGNPGLRVGDRNVFREYVTLHCATHDGAFTRVGSGNTLLAGCHVAHDCVLVDGVILANGCMLGGHVHAGDRAFISGGVAVHQFCRIGGGSLTSGNAVITEDLPPNGLAHGRNELAGLNLIGLRRRGVPARAVAELKRAYHAVYAPGQACAARAQAELATGSYHTAEGRAFLEFFLGGKRGRFVQPS